MNVNEGFFQLSATDLSNHLACRHLTELNRLVALGKMDYEDLLDERKAVAGLQFTAALPLKPRENTPTHRYTYPPQPWLHLQEQRM